MMFRWLTAIAILFASILPSVAQAQDYKSFYFTEWNSDINITSDGDAVIDEYFGISFTGSFSWFTRDIATPGGMTISDITVYDHLNNVDVTDLSEIVDSGYATSVTVNHNSTDIERYWTISYTAHNVINNYSTWDELYWNAVPDARGVAMYNVSADVHLPQPVNTNELQQRLFSGAYGTLDEVQSYWIEDQDTLHYEGYALGDYDNFTIVAGFPKGSVPDPPRVHISSDPDYADVIIKQGSKEVYTGVTPLTLYVGDSEDVPEGELTVIVSNVGYSPYEQTFTTPEQGDMYIDTKLQITWWYGLLAVLLLLLVIGYFLSPVLYFGVLFLRWRRKGRDPLGRKTIIPQYEPYREMKPGIVGTVIDETVDLEDISSTVVDLAIKGVMKIIEKRKGSYEFELLHKKYSNDKTLVEYERELLDIFFSKGKKTNVKLSSLRYKFANHLPDLREMMYTQAVDDGWFVSSPDKVRKKYRRIGWILTVVGLAGTFLYFLGLPILAYGIITLLFSKTMPKRTQEGVHATEWSKGLKMYLHHAERYRLQNLTPEIFERMLPYAMVFGVEKDWAKNFEELYLHEPDWYSGYSGADMFAIGMFTDNLSGAMVKTMTTTMTAVRSSSTSGSYSGAAGGSSGFSSGGGFYGGGYGGGGFSAG